MSLADIGASDANALPVVVHDMKILVLDIETAPNLAYVWGLWDQNVGVNQVEEFGHVICFAAKWLHQKKVRFHSDHHDGHAEMVEAAWALMSEADVVVHYNGKAFDVKHLHREFLLADLGPPAPHKDIDLLSVARQRFKFASNKLDSVAKALGIGAKVQHGGFELWRDCIRDDPKAWATMRRYNIGDVRLTEEVYLRMLPWIKAHPAPGLYDDSWTVTARCTQCGGRDLVEDGYAMTSTTRFRRYRCRGCGAWLRGVEACGRSKVRPAA